VDVIMREVRSTKAYDGNTPLLTQVEAEEIVRDHLPKKMGKQYKGEISVLRIDKKVQVSLNNDFHLVVRAYPEIAFKYVDDSGNEAYGNIAVQDTDVLVVFDRQETREIVEFVKEFVRY